MIFLRQTTELQLKRKFIDGNCCSSISSRSFWDFISSTKIVFHRFDISIQNVVWNFDFTRWRIRKKVNVVVSTTISVIVAWVPQKWATKKMQEENLNLFQTWRNKGTEMTLMWAKSVYTANKFAFIKKKAQKSANAVDWIIELRWHCLFWAHDKICFNEAEIKRGREMWLIDLSLRFNITVFVWD